MTIHELCELIGKKQTLASMCGVTETTVSNWIKRGFVPTQNWSAIVNGFHKRGFGVGVVTYKHLAIMAANAMEEQNDQ